MKTPETSRLFSRWRNPSNGVESLILTERAAPVQSPFYFTNRGFTDDGRFLWLACADPAKDPRPGAGVLAVVDFEQDRLRVFPGARFWGNPAVDLRSGEIYWLDGMELWKRGSGADDKPVRVNRVPEEIARGRQPERIASHLTFSADGASVNIDARFDGETTIGDLPLDGSPLRVWQRIPGFYDHGQFSPTDPDLQMFAHEFWKDHEAEPFDGLRPYHRLWLIRRGGQAEPILPEPVSHSGHEWWDPDGKHIWFVHYGVAVKKVNLQTRKEESLWAGHLAHAYSDRTGRYLVSDMMPHPHHPTCHVAFRDTRTGAEVEIVNAPPMPPTAVRWGHTHPHPQFCCSDRYVGYVTTVHGRIDLALVPTADLIERARNATVRT
ncbi:MAG TPA: hypothetical protein PK082_08350 [Phycisphaerae bacterium]|nr:hypothetical protein [Phycisphaerae bacterium]